MKELNNEEKIFHEIMSQSKLNVPFSDFDDKVMLLIKQRNSKSFSVSKELKLAWFFFIVGSTFGITISIALPSMQKPFLGMHPAKLAILFQVIFAFLFILQLDSLKNLYNAQTRKKLAD